MNFGLTDEQELLKEAARGTLARTNTVAAARDAIEGAALPDLWPAACDAGWPGLLIGESAGGAGLDAMDAMLVFEEMGRVLASVALLGHLPATLVLDAAGHGSLGELASGASRAAFVAARPPSDVEERWTVDPMLGSTRAPAPTVTKEGVVTGSVAWVPDAPGADALVAVATDATYGARAVLLRADAGGLEVELVTRYDATRPMGHVRMSSVQGELLEVEEGTLAAAFSLAGALIGAESLGAADRALEVAVEYAKERFTFGRAIGSYQAIKHQLVEVLRRTGNARALMFYAGWAGQSVPEEFAVASAAFRLAAGRALDEAARVQINVHGGIGATFEHDAPLYFRRAQLSRRLLGGTAGAADRVAGEVFRAAAAA